MGELHRKLRENFESKLGALPAVLAVMRLSGLINPERIPEAAEIIIARARTAKQPLEVEFLKLFT
ncbi:MAG: hypothetical protein EBZ48_11810 [Proteobacteria bacterium]|nr:hypothetical protein [Pseudomonadota bacterium]